MDWMLCPASVHRRGRRDEAALCQADGSRRGPGAPSGGALGGQGARARLPAHGPGYAPRHGRRPNAVSFLGVSGNRTLLPQSDGRSFLYGIGSGIRQVHRAPSMKHLSCSLIAALFAIAVVGAVADGPAAVAASSAAPLGQQGVTLEKIMSDPDWIGAAVKDAYWSVDGRAAYYSVKRSGSPIVDLHRVDLTVGKDQVVEPKAMAGADGPAVFDAVGKRAAFVRNGDIFVRDLGQGRLTQITRTPENEAAPQISADGRLLGFRVNTA